MEFENKPSQFESKWQEIIEASRREDYDHVDGVLVPELADCIENGGGCQYLFERMTQSIEPDWVIRDAAVATLNIDVIMQKVDTFDMRGELKEAMEEALVSDNFPWISANAMNWLIKYTDPSDDQRQAVIKAFTDQAERRASNPEEEFADRWTKSVLQEEVSFLSDIPEIAEWFAREAAS